MDPKQYKVSVPEGTSGDWSVQKFEVSAADETRERMRAAFNPHRAGRFTPKGIYTRLVVGGRTTVMSDTPDEIWDHYDAISNAGPRCLLNGLGLGVVLGAILRKDKVHHVTVIEISPDVISLVGSHYERMHPGKVTIIEADAFMWIPPKGVRYNMVWHDIWPTICGDNLEEMKMLHRKYGRRCSWQGSWARSLCERQ